MHLQSVVTSEILRLESEAPAETREQEMGMLTRLCVEAARKGKEGERSRGEGRAVNEVDAQRRADECRETELFEGSDGQMVVVENKSDVKEPQRTLSGATFPTSSASIQMPLHINQARNSVSNPTPFPPLSPPSNFLPSVSIDPS